MAHIFQLHGSGEMPEAQLHTTKYVMYWMEVPLSKYKDQLKLDKKNVQNTYRIPKSIEDRLSTIVHNWARISLIMAGPL